MSIQNTATGEASFKQNRDVVLKLAFTDQLGQNGFIEVEMWFKIFNLKKNTHVRIGESPDLTMKDFYDKDCHTFTSVHKRRSSLSVCSNTNNSRIT